MKTEGIPIRKKIAQNTESDAYRKLRNTAKLLEQQIAESRGLPNKELERFAEELDKLMKKYRIESE